MWFYCLPALSNHCLQKANKPVVETNKNGKLEKVKFKDIPPPRYTVPRGNRTNNIFRNQWNSEGTKRWNIIGAAINSERRFLNEFFDDRMKRFALKKETQERRKQKREEPDIDPDHPIFSDYNKPRQE